MMLRADAAASHDSSAGGGAPAAPHGQLPCLELPCPPLPPPPLPPPPLPAPPALVLLAAPLPPLPPLPPTSKPPVPPPPAPELEVLLAFGSFTHWPVMHTC